MARTNLNSVLEDDNVKTVIISTTWYSDSYIDVYNNKLNKSSLKKSITELIKEMFDIHINVTPGFYSCFFLWNEGLTTNSIYNYLVI